MLYLDMNASKTDLFCTIKRNTISDDTITVPVYSVISLSKHVDDTVSDNRVMNDFFNINFNNNENKLSLAYEYRNDITVLDKFDINEVSIFSLKKNGFTNRVFRIFSVNAIFNSSKFHRYYSRGLQL